MLDLSSTPDEFLQPIACVVEAALRHADSLRSEDVMVVGAWCRDIQHHALGHRFATSATRDLDLALALSSWDAYRALADAFPWVGDTGIRFRIAESPSTFSHSAKSKIRKAPRNRLREVRS
jgi:predicted nucleotidyltransferase